MTSMTPAEVLDDLTRRGVRIERRDDPVHPLLLAPRGRIPAETMAWLVEHKFELAELLTARVPPSRAWADRVPPPIERPPSDPRPELLEDSLAWTHLLTYASPDKSDFAGLFGILHGARSGGAALKFKQGRWRLEPRIDPAERVSIWQDEAAWEADRGRYLLPHRARLTKLLRLVPAPSRVGAPPSEVEAGVAALRALGWTFKVKAEGGLTATSADGLGEADVAWCRAHVDQIVDLVRGESE